MTPRWDKVEDGETMAPEATVVALAEVDTVVVEAVATEVAAVEATRTTVVETEVVVDTVEAVGVVIKAVVVVDVEVVVMVVDTVVMAGAMTEVIVEAGEVVEETAVAWTAIVAAESSTIHSPSTKACVVATSAKQTRPSLPHNTSRKPNHMGQAQNSAKEIQVALHSTKLVIRATTVTTALFTLAT